MKVLFAGGGTAGHVNPALAVAKRLLAYEEGSDIRFVGTETGLEARLVPQAGFHLYTMDMRGLSRKMDFAAVKHNIKAVSEAIMATGRVTKIFSEFRPDIVVGAGGYASYPAVRAALKEGIPTALLEMNALPGIVTKALAGKVDRVMVAFDATARRLTKKAEIVLTGSPVRDEIIFANRRQAKEALELLDKPLVVSFWGSLGAAEMNRIISDFICLSDKDRSFYHIHATGSFGWKWVPQHLTGLGVPLSGRKDLDVREYIYDMPRVMAAADLLICRAGASTLAEICAAGRASILIPSPNVAENHQEINARALEDAGAAIVMTEKEADGKRLHRLVCGLLSQPERLQQMEKNASALAVYDAADRMCKAIREIVVSKRRV